MCFLGSMNQMFIQEVGVIYNEVNTELIDYDFIITVSQT
jgi:hypothetical protein